MFFEEQLELLHIEHELGKSTAEISAIKAGGPAEIVVLPKNEEELIFTILASREAGLPYRVIGNCTNTLFRDSGFGGVIILTRKISSFRTGAGFIVASCGASFSRISRILAESGISLAPEMSGIPGSVGGMVRGNAGAYGICCADILTECRVYDVNNDKIRILTLSDMGFDYRRSILAENNMILLSARFITEKKDYLQIHNSLLDFSSRRREKQPHEPSLGSFFKRPPGAFASELIDKAALRGCSIGGASVSEKHAGFIINRNHATARDIEDLSLYVKERVLERFGISLENEVEIV